MPSVWRSLNSGTSATAGASIDAPQDEHGDGSCEGIWWRARAYAAIELNRTTATTEALVTMMLLSRYLTTPRSHASR